MIKKKENIAEYILFMWQAEDFVRAFGESEDVENNTFLHDLRSMMQQEGVMQKGHVQISLVALSEMEQLHSELYQSDASYRAAWLALLPAMTIFKSKTDEPAMSDIMACLTFLYDIMLLKLKKQDISTDTAAVQKQVTALMRYISTAFKQEKNDD